MGSKRIFTKREMNWACFCRSLFTKFSEDLVFNVTQCILLIHIYHQDDLFYLLALRHTRTGPKYQYDPVSTYVSLMNNLYTIHCTPRRLSIYSFKDGIQVGQPMYECIMTIDKKGGVQ
jgi:hypothetical protein